jgi:hypothetical protein
MRKRREEKNISGVILVVFIIEKLIISINATTVPIYKS